jgi:hypothetical protein
MKVREATSERFVITHQRPVWAVSMAIFTLMSAFTLVNLILQGIQQWSRMDGFQVVAFFIWVTLAIFLVLLGASITHNAGRGMLIEFDKPSETVRLRLPNLWRASWHNYPIYGISHLHIERNDDVRVVGVFLVLRHGERIALGTVTPFDLEAMQALAKEVKGFLRADR